MTESELISVLEDNETQNLLGNIAVFQSLFCKAELNVLEKYIVPALKDFAAEQGLLFSSKKLPASFKFYFYKAKWKTFRIAFCVETRKTPFFLGNTHYKPRNIVAYGVKSFGKEKRMFSRKKERICRILTAHFPTTLCSSSVSIWEAPPVQNFTSICKENSEKIVSFFTEKTGEILSALGKI